MNFDVLRIVATITQRGGDRGNVGLESIGGDLKPLLAGSRVAQAFDENFCGGLIAAGQGEIQDEFGMLLHRHVAVSIALGIVILLGGQLVGFLLGDVAPDFVGLNVLNRDVDDQSAHELLAAFPGEYQGLHDRVAIHASDIVERIELPSSKSLRAMSIFSSEMYIFAKGEAMRFSIGLVALRAAKRRRPLRCVPKR